MIYSVILLDHEKIGAEDLQMMQFGNFEARVKRVRTAVQAGLCKRLDNIEAMTRDSSAVLFPTKQREVAVGDLLIDPAGKVYFYDHHGGWDNVTKQCKFLLKSTKTTEDQNE